jgi:hypothetical protein
MLHGNLETLYSHLVDMHKLIPEIEDGIEFQK